MEILLTKFSLYFVGFVKSFYRFVKVRNLLILNFAFLFANVAYFGLKKTLTESVESEFLPPLDPEQNDLLDRTFRTFVDAMDRHNVEFFLFSGSLLGSVRHHGRIPWDDDIDVLVNASDRDRVTQALLDTDQRSYNIYNWAWSGDDYFYQWKFFPTNGRRLIHSSFTTPNVDIFFYLENDTHIWNASPSFSSEIWPKSFVFPLRRRPFGDVMVPAPCNVDAFLGLNFDISICSARSFSHVFNLPMSLFPMTVPCSRLFRLYPFVHRSQYKNGSVAYVMETLRLEKWTLRKFVTRLSC